MTAHEHADMRIAQAHAAFERRQFEEAHALAMDALSQDRSAHGALHILAMIAAEHGVHDKALRIIDQALILHDEQSAYHALRGRCLAYMRRYAEAREAATRAADLKPADALTLDTIGVVHSHAGFHATAVGFFERAAAADPRNPNILHNLGVSRQFSGDFEGARAAYEAEAALRPAARRPYAALVQLSKQTRERNFIAELEAQFAAAPDADAKLELGHALAKSYEDLGDDEAALAWLIRAKAGKRDRAEPALQALREAFAGADAPLRAPPAPDCRDEAPIFVVGMPRTGTTLVDRILSSHPDVVSVGELGAFATAAQAVARKHGGPVFTEAAQDFATLGRAYLEAARPLAGEAPRFVDKMPMNAFYAALIHRALPNARIICLRRHPMDACLSNFRQLFGRDARFYHYAYALEATAGFYALFDGLVARFRAGIPPERFLELSYEALVEDLEGQTRRMLDFCGLPWDARCLAFHENTAPVATASSVQVRAPLYATSVGRWRRLGAALDPLAAALRSHGVVFD